MNKKELLSKTSNETGFAHVLIESAFDEIIRIIADEIEARFKFSTAFKKRINSKN